MHSPKAYIKLAIFGADGVTTGSKTVATALEKDFGTKPEALAAFYEGPFQEVLLGKADLKASLSPFLKDWNWTGTVEAFLAYWFRAEEGVNKTVIEEIRTLRERGIKCYLAMNKEKYHSEYLREKMGFKSVFNGIFSSADLGAKKPEKIFFERLLKRIDPKRKIQHREILFWDESPAAVKAARDMGIQAYLYTDPDAFEETMSQVLIASQRFLKPRK